VDHRQATSYTNRIKPYKAKVKKKGQNSNAPSLRKEKSGPSNKEKGSARKKTIRDRGRASST